MHLLAALIRTLKDHRPASTLAAYADLRIAPGHCELAMPTVCGTANPKSLGRTGERTDARPRHPEWGKPHYHTTHAATATTAPARSLRQRLQAADLAKVVGQLTESRQAYA